MASDPSIVDPVGRLAEEFVARYRKGERPVLSEYIERYPEHAARIQKLFPMLVLMEQAGSGAEAGTNATLLPAGTDGAAAGSMPDQVGGYRILREIGRGGMGVVYEAEQLALGRRVALKVLPLHAGQSDSGLERFRREAKAAARLDHTNIVPVYEVGEEGAVCYYAMQLVHGQPLDQVLDELRKFRQMSAAPPAEASVARALLTGSFRQDRDGPAAPVAHAPGSDGRGTASSVALLGQQFRTNDHPNPAARLAQFFQDNRQLVHEIVPTLGRARLLIVWRRRCATKPTHGVAMLHVNLAVTNPIVISSFGLPN